ncbi:TPA: hypothetical protein ACQ62H_001967 [Neisseria polysaccharea]
MPSEGSDGIGIGESASRRVGFSPPIPPISPHQEFLVNRRDSAVSVFGVIGRDGQHCWSWCKWRSWWDWRKRWDWWAEAHPTACPMPTLHICPAPASVNGECIKNAV